MEDKTINELEKEKEKIMEAVKLVIKIKPIIKKILNFGTDIKMIHSMLLNHADKITQETYDRKSEIKRVTDNYKERFERIENLINNDIKNMLKGAIKLVINLFITIITLFLGSTAFILLNAVFKWIIFK